MEALKKDNVQDKTLCDRLLNTGIEREEVDKEKKDGIEKERGFLPQVAINEERPCAVRRPNNT